MHTLSYIEQQKCETLQREREREREREQKMKTANGIEKEEKQKNENMKHFIIKTSHCRVFSIHHTFHCF